MQILFAYESSYSAKEPEVSAQTAKRKNILKTGKEKGKACKKNLGGQKDTRIAKGKSLEFCQQFFSAVLAKKAGLGWFLGNSLEATAREKIRETGHCSIFEIGSGFGVAIDQLKENFGIRGMGGKLTVKGIDIMHNVEESAAIMGNALSKPFPKSDIIFSVWSLGYIGNIGFMVRKIANALNEKGIAVLHINKVGRVNGMNEVLIKDTETLRDNIAKIKIPSCKIRAKLMGDLPRVRDTAPRDLAIVIEKD